jgi:hypothetical protein
VPAFHCAVIERRQGLEENVGIGHNVAAAGGVLCMVEAPFGYTW